MAQNPWERDWSQPPAKPAAAPAPWEQDWSAPAASGPMSATGQVHDGDTFRLNDGRNARLLGVDAFELDQQGRSRAGQPVPLGAQGRDLLSLYAKPAGTVSPAGSVTYGRPVVTLDNGGDAGAALLDKGLGLAQPQYLKADANRLFDYAQRERLSRLNGRGAFAGTYQRPSDYRAQQKTPIPEREEAIFFDDRSTRYGFAPETEKGYLSIAGDMASTPEQLIAYTRANGMDVPEASIRSFYAQRAKAGGANANAISYVGKPRPVINPGDGATGAVVRGIFDPVNFLDEFGGLANTVIPTDARENIWSSDRRFGDILGNNTDQWRDTLAYDDAYHPYARFGGQMAGGLLLPGASVEGVGFAAARSAIRGGASRYAAEAAARSAVLRRLGTAGAIEGGAAGVGQGTDLRSRAVGGAIGAPLGYGLGVGAGIAAPKIASLIGRPFNKLAGREGERSAQNLTEGAVDAAKADTQNASIPTGDPLSTVRGALEVDALARTVVQRQRDRLSLPPRPGSPATGMAADEVGRTPLITALPLRPAPPARTLDEVQPDIDRWAAERGAGQSDSAYPEVMLHGSSNSGIDTFDPYGRSGYGLFGTGTYLTDSAKIAAEYTGKGLSRAQREAAAGRTIYAVRQAVKNPLDMDAPASPESWGKVWRAWGEDAPDLPPGTTNEQAWRDLEEYVSSMQVPKWEGAEMMDSAVRAMGHDGITHIGGGRVNKDGPRHRVVIALDPEQTEIVDRLSVGGLMQPPGPRNPDWIDIGAVPPTGRGVASPSAYTQEPLPPWERDWSVPMASEVDTPTMYGPEVAPRTVDRIDVQGQRAPWDMDWNKASPMLDPVSAARREAEANRLEPRDLLPLPANTVNGLDEADRITAGRMAPVRAPNERDALTGYSVRSSTTGTPLRRRGPMDMVTWLRSQGGIRAEGGELAHFGIDNTPRKGMDFAGGEGQLGRLVSNDGMGWDDAAYRAWEAGYFPGHSERPTIKEFLDALNETHTGRNRAFLPDDLDEVRAFEATRQQRWAVEGAAARDAPMVEDRGQPVGMDDLDANSAPVEAYVEWGENAPNLAGNIRLDKLDSPQAIKRALVQVDRVSGGFDAARRGRITQAETQRLAAELGMTADDLLKRRKGQAFNAEEALAARQILARSSTDLVNISKRIQRMDNPGDEVDAAFKRALMRHVAIQEQVAGITAEAGRTLQAMKMVADAQHVDRVLPSLGDMIGGNSRVKEIADRIVDLERTGTGPGGIAVFTAKAIKPRFRDQLTELYMNFLLSGPQTHAVNVMSNTMTALLQIPEHLAAAGLGGVRAMARSDADRVLFSEVGARTVGLLNGAHEGLRQARRTMLTGEPADAASKVEAATQRAIPTVVGSVIRTPTRALSAEDEFFKAIARRMELSGIAVREAAKEGLRGEAGRKRAAELLANPTDDMLARSFDYARYVTFQTPLAHNSMSGAISRGTQSNLLFKLVIPFVRTPVNILRFAAERSPLGAFMQSWQSDIAAGGARRDLAAARMMLGTGLMATAGMWAAEGKLTGGGPADPAAMALMRANGWQPYSVKIGDQYYSYARLDPLSTTLGVAADYVELQSHMTEKQREHVGMLLGASAFKNLSNKVWFSGVSDLSDAVNDWQRYGDGFVNRLLGGMAVPTGVSQVARTMDPTLREAKTLLDTIRSRVPGASDKLLPRRDVWGEPIVREGGVGPDIMSPVWTSTDRRDPVATALLAADATFGNPSRGDMTPEQYNAFQRDSGRAIHTDLRGLIGSAEWRAAAIEDRGAMVKKLVAATRKRTKAGMFGAKPWERPAPASASDSRPPWERY